MENKTEILQDFFGRLRKAGFRVESMPEGELAAEGFLTLHTPRQCFQNENE